MDWMLAVICPLVASGTVLVQNGCSFCCQLVRLDQVPTTLKVCFGRSCAVAAAPPAPIAAASASDATTRLSIDTSLCMHMLLAMAFPAFRRREGDAASCDRSDLGKPEKPLPTACACKGRCQCLVGKS